MLPVMLEWGVLSFYSVVTRFLELLTAQVLNSSSGAPCGLQFHILDIYMTELAAVGSAEVSTGYVNAPKDVLGSLCCLRLEL